MGGRGERGPQGPGDVWQILFEELELATQANLIKFFGGGLIGVQAL